MPSTHYPLNPHTFFKFWACRAFSKVSKEKLNKCERFDARISAIAFGVFTLGIGTLICRFCLYDRKVIHPDQVKKYQKQRLEKIFAGRNDQRKIKEVKEYFQWRLGDPAKVESNYNFLNKIRTNTNFSEFILKNKSTFTDELIEYASLNRCAELIDSHGDLEKINSLQKKVLRRGNNNHYFKFLFKHCAFENIARHVIRSDNTLKELFLAHLSTLEFPDFKEKYNCIRNILLENGTSNFLLNPNPCENSSLVTVCNKAKTLAFTCEALEALTCEPQERNLQLTIINNTIRPIAVQHQSLMWKLLGSHCKVKDIPFLLIYRFGFSGEETTLKTKFFPKLVDPTDQEKWEASIPHVWDWIDKLHLFTPIHTSEGETDSIITRVIKSSLASKDKFEFVLKSLIASNTPHRTNLIAQCLHYINPQLQLLPFYERIEVMENILWPQCVNWVNNPGNQEDWYQPPFDYTAVMFEYPKYQTQFEFFQNAYGDLIHLLLKFKDETSSPMVIEGNFPSLICNDSLRLVLSKLDCANNLVALLLASKSHYQQLSPLLYDHSKKGILNLIELIKKFNEKGMLVPDVDELEELLKSEEACNRLSPGVWTHLHYILERVLFDAVMRKLPFQLFP